MKLYVGITDGDWCRYLRSTHADEMNFWRPRATSQFKALDCGELFLFKSKYPHHRIIVGAFFVRHTTLSLDLAWKAFGAANGSDSLDKLRLSLASLHPRALAITAAGKRFGVVLDQDEDGWRA